MKRNSSFVCFILFCMILFTSSQLHAQDKNQTSSANVYLLANVTEEAWTISPLLGNNIVQQSGASISGFLLAQDNSPQIKTEIRLIKVRLVNLLGKEIVNLPPKETAIIDSDGKAIEITKTDSSGKFDFKNVQPGRYSLAVQLIVKNAADQRWLEENPGSTVFFDVVDANKVELGRLKASKQ